MNNNFQKDLIFGQKYEKKAQELIIKNLIKQ